MRTSSRLDPVGSAVSKHHVFIRSQAVTSFTIFEPCDINFAIVVYSECMPVDHRLALIQLWGHGGQHGEESEEGKESKEDSQEEKEVIVR
jgi:hypothetical protein